MPAMKAPFTEPEASTLLISGTAQGFTIQRTRLVLLGLAPSKAMSTGQSKGSIWPLSMQSCILGRARVSSWMPKLSFIGTARR